MKTLGIIGGMGPVATVDLYSKIIANTPSLIDQDHIHVIIDSYPQIEDRTAFICGKGDSPFPKLLEAARRLEKAGADVLIMPCNTAHYFYDELSKGVSVPIIHIVDATAQTMRKEYPDCKNVALFATDGTKRAQVYSKVLLKFGYSILDLGAELENNIMECIYSGVKAGKVEEYVPLFAKCVTEAENLGADVMIAGCTEIPILLPYITTKKPVIDPTLELAKAGVSFVIGK